MPAIIENAMVVFMACLHWRCEQTQLRDKNETAVLESWSSLPGATWVVAGQPLNDHHQDGKQEKGAPEANDRQSKHECVGPCVHGSHQNSDLFGQRSRRCRVGGAATPRVSVWRGPTPSLAIRAE